MLQCITMAFVFYQNPPLPRYPRPCPRSVLHPAADRGWSHHTQVHGIPRTESAVTKEELHFYEEDLGKHLFIYIMYI